MQGGWTRGRCSRPWAWLASSWSPLPLKRCSLRLTPTGVEQRRTAAPGWPLPPGVLLPCLPACRGGAGGWGIVVWLASERSGGGPAAAPPTRPPRSSPLPPSPHPTPPHPPQKQESKPVPSRVCGNECLSSSARVCVVCGWLWVPPSSQRGAGGLPAGGCMPRARGSPLPPPLAHRPFHPPSFPTIQPTLPVRPPTLPARPPSPLPPAGRGRHLSCV